MSKKWMFGQGITFKPEEGLLCLADDDSLLIEGREPLLSISCTGEP